MFEQSVVEARVLANRPWTVAVSFAGQSALIGLAILIPLLHPDMLGRAQFWIPVISPPPAFPRPSPARVDAVRQVAAKRVFRAGALVAPASVPQRVVMLQDPDEAAPAVAGELVGVPGGMEGPAGALSPVISNILRRVPVAAAPPVAAAAPVQEAPKPPQRVRVGGVVRPPELIYGPQPVYPPLARQARISGTVQLEAVIGTDGRIQQLRAAGGHPLLVPAAIEAVKRWQYRPTLLNGDPVELGMEIKVVFTMQ